MLEILLDTILLGQGILDRGLDLSCCRAVCKRLRHVFDRSNSWLCLNADGAGPIKPAGAAAGEPAHRALLRGLLSRTRRLSVLMLEDVTAADVAGISQVVPWSQLKRLTLDRDFKSFVALVPCTSLQHLELFGSFKVGFSRRGRETMSQILILRVLRVCVPCVHTTTTSKVLLCIYLY